MNEPRFARVLKAETAEALGFASLAVEAPAETNERIIAPDAPARIRRARVLEAEAEGDAVVQRAREEAGRILAEAQRVAGELRLRAEAEGRAQGIASLGDRLARLAARETEREAHELERAMTLARLLAERLLTETVTLEPERVIALAKQVLREARSARQITIHAHPEDTAVLSAHLQDLGIPGDAIRRDPALGRGELRIETEIGTLDARFGPALDKLMRALGPLLTSAATDR